jgi:hypothetical protein
MLVAGFIGAKEQQRRLRKQAEAARRRDFDDDVHGTLDLADPDGDDGEDDADEEHRA